MNYSDIKIPFINTKEIRKNADLFRDKFWDNSIPVDIEKIIDVKLEIDVILSLNLKQYCDSDALISSNWKSIYVDQNEYLDERYQNRLRFSLAHEIGHFILHKDIYNSFKITSLEKFYHFIDEIPGEQYGFLETQADIFANNLLVPRDRLAIEKKKMLSKLKAKNINIDDFDKELLQSYISEPISRIFCVSPQVIIIALNKQ